MTTTRFTKEQLIKRLEEQMSSARYALGFVQDSEILRDIEMDLRLAEIARASLEAEPVSFDALRDAVAEVSGGPAMEWSDIYKGHQAVPFINFNSLARIVDKFRDSLAAPTVTFFRDGIEAAAAWVDQQRDSYDTEHGRHDPDTGAFEFGNDAQRDYSATLEEIAEGIRALHPNTAPPAPVVPDEKPMPNPLKMYAVDAVAAIAEVRGWNDCRAAMLQGKADGNSPVIPDRWIPVSERMPEDAQWCAVNTEYGYYVQCWSEGQGWLGDEISLPSCDVTHWMPLPAAPQQEAE